MLPRLKSPSLNTEVVRFSYRLLSAFHMSHLSRNEVCGEVERRRLGVREGEGWAWKTAQSLPEQDDQKDADDNGTNWSPQDGELIELRANIAWGGADRLTSKFTLLRSPVDRSAPCPF
ncbi:hypothetical protein RB5611 [Rhodopirellula baltica SH 1]|uniref:Uncharacterized protein n=1 Tax=Rhodopirellula baltica (strain DSM 10527 / NCIMB 13988 / SH1) TaxID=243090 RepID=Q7URK5_RHOBA|nr:hypothetical protein RB5611 [Rhodopirellula baltica SH 1]